MSTYSASKAVALPQSAEEGAAFAGRPLSLPASFPAGGTGVFASLAWVGFGVSCLWWEDLGDWSRTHELGGRGLRHRRRHFRLATVARQPARAASVQACNGARHGCWRSGCS